MEGSLSVRSLSREVLYTLVWTTPISRLARDFGISDRGLSKICDRLEVPVPPRGYWARKEAGQAVVQYRLLKASPGTPLSVDIAPTPPPEVPTPVPKPADNSRADLKDGQLAVPERLNKPHPIIAGWIERRAKDREELRRWGNTGRSTLPDFSELERRRHRILSTLFKALEAHGHAVSETSRGDLQANLGGKQVAFRLREKLKQVKRPLTDDDKRWGYGTARGYRTETVGSGYLIFEFQTYLPGKFRREWLETDEARLETLAGDILATILAAVPLLEAQRFEEEAMAARRREEEVRRAEIARQRKFAANRLAKFGQFAEQWARMGQMRALLAELEGTVADPAEEVTGQSLAEWMAWLREQIDRHDPSKVGLAGVCTDLAAVDEWWRND